jgi:hypothetical protein
MCPLCLASAGWVAGTVISSGGVGALFVNGFHATTRKSPKTSDSAYTNERGKENGHRNQQDGATQSRAARRMGSRTQGVAPQREGVHQTA